MQIKSTIPDSYKKAVVEGLKTVVRIFFLAALPIAIAGYIEYLQNDGGDIFEVTKSAAVQGAIAVLIFADKFVHKLGKETGNETLIKGITRF